MCVAFAPLPGDADPPVARIERPAGRSDFLIACDHGGRAIPRRLRGLGLPAHVLGTHVAWDLGVADLGARLSERLDAWLIVNNYSRLVIDVNRPPGAIDSIVALSERTRIAANDGIPPAEARRRLEEVFLPYHRHLRDALDARASVARRSVLVALHSFTPVYLGEPRPWHVGVLYGRDPRLARLVLDGLRRDPALVVGDNQPYAVSDATDYTVVVHGEQRGLPHVELEIRQDLLASDDGVARWAARLGDVLEESLRRLVGD